MQRSDQEHEGRQPLLTVDEHEFGGLPVTAHRREDRADEVHVPVIGVRDGADVSQQLLARTDVPAILALIHRNDDGQIAGEPRDGVDRGRIDVRGIAGITGHSSSLGRSWAAPFSRCAFRGRSDSPG